MQLKFRNCLFALTISLFVLWSGVPARAEAAKNTNTASTAPASATTAKDTIATVNGTAVAQGQFDNALNYQLEMAKMQGATLTDTQLSELKYQILGSLIDEELLYQESQRSGIKIEEKEINGAYEERKQKAKLKTDAEFEEALKKSNKSVTSYRTEIEHGLAVDRLIKNKFSDTIAVPDSDAKKYYDGNPGYFQQPARVRVSHIMVRVASDADQSKKDEAMKKIEQGMKRVKAGEDFATVAKEVSEDANSKNTGGDLGYLAKGQVQQSFEDAAFALQKDGTSDIVTTSAGYHIIKVTDKTDARTVSFEEVKSNIISNLKSNKVNSLVGSYIKELKNRSTIATYPISK